jgi:predicted TIM-barrel enzyme
MPTHASLVTQLFADQPPVIVAQHLSDLLETPHQRIAELERYVLANLEHLVQAGVPAVMLQEETRTAGPASERTIAMMSALGRTVRANYPDLSLGVIIQAHDPIAPLAIAHACDADFVRIKVCVGSSVSAEGTREGIGLHARNYRRELGRTDIALFADIHNRTGVPLGDVPMNTAASWAVTLGADALVITEQSFEQTLTAVDQLRASDCQVPLFIGGSITPENVSQGLQHADGVIVSSSLKARPPNQPHLDWDPAKVQALIARASPIQRVPR